MASAVAEIDVVGIDDDAAAPSAAPSAGQDESQYEEAHSDEDETLSLLQRLDKMSASLEQNENAKEFQRVINDVIDALTLQAEDEEEDEDALFVGGSEEKARAQQLLDELQEKNTQTDDSDNSASTDEIVSKIHQRQNTRFSHAGRR